MLKYVHLRDQPSMKKQKSQKKKRVVSWQHQRKYHRVPLRHHDHQQILKKRYLKVILLQRDCQQYLERHWIQKWYNFYHGESELLEMFPHPGRICQTECLKTSLILFQRLFSLKIQRIWSSEVLSKYLKTWNIWDIWIAKQQSILSLKSEWIATVHWSVCRKT